MTVGKHKEFVKILENNKVVAGKLSTKGANMLTSELDKQQPDPAEGFDVK